MYLKTLELFGFKSFAERTKFDFEEGISGIVGPNGCGKTNILDAIRWVLGEQSAKQLRGSRMEDVIFNGSSLQKPLSFAEVTLLFDNSKNILPVDYSEVLITRKLFRSGESEYYINKTLCRLKDIRDLFLDTGVGTDSYSLMEQGKVDFILTAKPEDRRFLFDEAAGVAKYKVRRDEALRKLEKVNDDLLRISDITKELQTQINRLDTQAKKARQYQKYQEELKKYEIANLIIQYKGLYQEYEKHKKVSDKNQDKLHKMTAEIDRIDSSLSELRTLLKENDDELIHSRRISYEIDSQIEMSNERISNAESREKELSENKSLAKKEITEKEGQIKKFNEENSSNEIEIEEFSKKISAYESEFKSTENELKKIENETSRITNELTTKRHKHFEIIESKNEINNKLTSFLATKENTIEKINELKKKEEFVQILLDQTVKKKEEISEEILKREHLLNGLTEDRKGFLNEKVQKEDEFNTLKDRFSILSVKFERLNEKINKIPNLLMQKYSGIFGSVRNLITVNPENVETVISSLGEKSDYIICDTKQTAIESISYLKDQKIGWATFLPLDSIPEFKEKKVYIGKKVKDIVSIDSKFSKAIDFLLSDTILDKGIVYFDGLIKGGFVLEEDIILLKTKIEGDKETISLIKKELEELLSRIETTGEKLQKTDKEYASLLKEMELLDEKIKSVNIELDSVKEDVTHYFSNEKELNISIKEIGENYEKFSVKQDEIKKEIENLENQLPELNQHYRNIFEKYTLKKGDYEVFKQRYDFLKEQKTRLKDFLETSSKRVKELKTILLDTENNYKKQAEIKKKEQENIEKLIADKDGAADDVKEFEKKREELLEDIKKEEESLKVKQKELQSVNETFTISEQEVTRYKTELKNIEENLQNSYQISVDDGLKTYSEIILEEGIIEKLKKKVEGLGAVNLAAPEEYEQIDQRYKSLLNQQNDLIKSKENLLATISKINATTKENFQKTFVLIRENFKKIFTQLFEGGEADVLLTNDTDLLETGVDIFAQPPGKKLQHISLLSGGERALTAIALLFAIFMVKPSPFCILDEVDAPLDDANLLRFKRMLVEFAKASQFLVVTHNKKTMEMVDTFYGATMEEAGVTKIISVKFRKDTKEEITTEELKEKETVLV